jgi:hypothetical protein
VDFLGWYGVSGFGFRGWKPAFGILWEYFCPLIVWLPCCVVKNLKCCVLTLAQESEDPLQVFGASFGCLELTD